MPLPKHGRGITRIGKHLRHGNFPLHQAVHSLAQRNRTVTAADRITSRHDGRAGRCALDFYIEIGQAQALVGQLIQSRRSSTANDSATIESGLPPTEIIQKDKDDVGFVLCKCDGT